VQIIELLEQLDAPPGHAIQLAPRAARENRRRAMKKTVKPLKVRKLTIDRETLRELVVGAIAVPPFTKVSCIVSQCPNTCTNPFDTCVIV